MFQSLDDPERREGTVNKRYRLGDIGRRDLRDRRAAQFVALLRDELGIPFRATPLRALLSILDQPGYGVTRMKSHRPDIPRPRKVQARHWQQDAGPVVHTLILSRAATPACRAGGIAIEAR